MLVIKDAFSHPARRHFADAQARPAMNLTITLRLTMRTNVPSCESLDKSRFWLPIALPKTAGGSDFYWSMGVNSLAGNGPPGRPRTKGRPVRAVNQRQRMKMLNSPLHLVHAPINIFQCPSSIKTSSFHMMSVLALAASVWL